jgi:hypothetical protein
MYVLLTTERFEFFSAKATFETPDLSVNPVQTYVTLWLPTRDYLAAGSGCYGAIDSVAMEIQTANF